MKEKMKNLSFFCVSISFILFQLGGKMESTNFIFIYTTKLENNNNEKNKKKLNRPKRQTHEMK